MDIQLSKKQKTVILMVSIGFIVLIFGYYTIQQLSRSGKIPINVKYAPFKSTVILNGKKIKNNAVNYISPGEYNVTVHYTDDFNVLTKKVIIDKDTTYIYDQLIANDESIYDDYYRDYLEVGGIDSDIISESNAKRLENLPLIHKLPIKNSLYSITYVVDRDENYDILIKSPSYYLNTSVRKLLDLDGTDGINLIDYNIKLDKKYNPFSESDDAS